jgi:poly(3-hydroxybutyrate) depolymerase
MRNNYIVFLTAGAVLAALQACGSGDGTGNVILIGGAGGSLPGAGTGAGTGADTGPIGGAAGQAAGGSAGTGSLAGTGAGSAGQGGMLAPTAGSSGQAGTAAGGGAGGSAGSAGAPPSSSPCTGKPGAPGTSARMLMNGALQRTFLVHIPASLDPNAPAPVLLVHHGFTMTGQLMEAITGFDAVADAEGFVVVYPDGGGAAPWNVGQGICGVGGAVAGVEDDFGFVDKMLADVEQSQCLDREHVFVTGFSMGGYFSNHIGCQQGNTKIRAVAPHSGGTYPGDCPGAPLPVMIVHGSGDALITPDCGMGARDYWVQRNGCSTQAESRTVMGGTCEWHMGCTAGAQVVLCMFDGMAHGWAGAPTTGANGFYGGGSQYQSATGLIWDFFKAQF